MSHDPNHMRAAAKALEKRREDRRQEAAAYQRECCRRVPELEGLDRAIQGTVAKAISAALRHGEDPGPAVEEARRENLALQARRLELLREKGLDPARLEVVPLCPECGDTGWRKGKPCRCLLELCAGENLKELGEQLDLEEMTFGRFSLDWYDQKYDPERGTSPRACMETVLEVCRDYAGQFPGHPFGNLYLYGGTGLGKTFLSGCIAGEVAGRGYWTVYVTAGQLFRQYETVKFGREEEDGARQDVRRFESCDLLVLDDLGSEMTTPFVQSALYQLLNQRINAGKRTVISSNLDMDGIRGRYTPQAASRLEGEYRGLPFLGQDIRIQRKGRG